MKNLSFDNLLDIYERFGKSAQDALDFVKRNICEGKDDAAATTGTSDEVNNQGPLEDGVYVVYSDGYPVPFSDGMEKSDVSHLGIIHDGHRVGIPLQGYYEPQPLFKKDNFPADSHCLNEIDALLNWDFVGETEYLKALGLNIPLKKDHYIPTLPVWLAMYAKREILNKALNYFGGEPIDFEQDYWLAQRYNVNIAWFFYGFNGSFDDRFVPSSLAVRGCTLL